jgi:hypothetical protein
MVSLGGQSISFFSMKDAMGAGQVFLVMGGYALALVMGALAAAKPPMLRWQGIVAALGFAFVLFKLRGGIGEFLKGAIGAKMMIVAALVGIVFSLLTVAKPETAK